MLLCNASFSESFSLLCKVLQDEKKSGKNCCDGAGKTAKLISCLSVRRPLARAKLILKLGSYLVNYHGEQLLKKCSTTPDTSFNMATDSTKK